jgi:hypothetical protein
LDKSQYQLARNFSMGEEKKATSFRLSEETLRQIDHIKQAFHPFCEDRSSTLRLIVNIMYAIIFTPTTLRDVVDVLQRVHRTTSNDNVVHKQLHLVFGEPAPTFFPRIWPSNRNEEAS